MATWKERLQEAKALFDEGLIDEDEYKELRAKALALKEKQEEIEDYLSSQKQEIIELAQQEKQGEETEDIEQKILRLGWEVKQGGKLEKEISKEETEQEELSLRLDTLLSSIRQTGFEVEKPEPPFTNEHIQQLESELASFKIGAQMRKQVIHARALGWDSIELPPPPYTAQMRDELQKDVQEQEGFVKECENKWGIQIPELPLTKKLVKETQEKIQEQEKWSAQIDSWNKKGLLKAFLVFPISAEGFAEAKAKAEKNKRKRLRKTMLSAIIILISIGSGYWYQERSSMIKSFQSKLQDLQAKPEDLEIPFLADFEEVKSRIERYEQLEEWAEDLETCKVSVRPYTPETLKTIEKYKKMQARAKELSSQHQISLGFVCDERVFDFIEQAAKDKVDLKAIDFNIFDVELWANRDKWRPVVKIPAGKFIMGWGERAHPVILTKDFLMMKTEVTRGLYLRLMEKEPDPNLEKKNHPIQAVSWRKAVQFANKLSAAEGLEQCYEITSEVKWNRDCKGWRLPTEAEWEYAARGPAAATQVTRAKDELYAAQGPKTANIAKDGFHYRDPNLRNIDEIAWYGKNSGGEAHEVCTKKETAYGLCDIYGNVGEWTWDVYAGAYGYFDEKGIHPSDRLYLKVGTRTDPAFSIEKYDSTRVYREGDYQFTNEWGLQAWLRCGGRHGRSTPCRSDLVPKDSSGYRITYPGFRLVRTL